MKIPKLGIVILAAGKGKRMHSDVPKVLHEVSGKSMLSHVVDTSRSLSPDKIVPVVGFKADLVKEAFQGQSDLFWAIQEPMLGTGHAVQFTKRYFDGFEGNILVLYGDVPAITSHTLNELIDEHLQSRKAVTLLTALLQDPYGYGRIIKDEHDHIIEIVEEKDASEDQRKIQLVNTGIGIYDAKFLMEAVFQLQDNNKQKEYYLTDVILMAAEKGLHVGSVVAKDARETFGVNSPEGLNLLEDIMKNR